ncbi:MAG: hypothetical protein QXI89_00670 [Candidatus Anstonellales archaeon]
MLGVGERLRNRCLGNVDREQRKSFRKIMSKLNTGLKRFKMRFLAFIVPALLSMSSLSCAQFMQRIRVETPFSNHIVANNSNDFNAGQEQRKSDETLTSIERVYGKNTKNGYNYKGFSLSSFDKDRLLQFSLSLLSSEQHMIGKDESSITTPKIPEDILNSDEAELIKRLIENKEIARIEKETKRREFLISPAVYINFFSISYPDDIKEKFRLRLHILGGVQYTYIWRFDTSKYTIYTKDIVSEDEKNLGKINIPFTSSDDDERIDLCFKVQGNIALLNFYINNCLAPKPSGPFKYNPEHTLSIGVGIIF